MAYPKHRMHFWQVVHAAGRAADRSLLGKPVKDNVYGFPTEPLPHPWMLTSILESMLWVNFRCLFMKEYRPVFLTSQGSALAQVRSPPWWL
jgi:hypothetical protein